MRRCMVIVAFGAMALVAMSGQDKNVTAQSDTEGQQRSRADRRAGKRTPIPPPTAIPDVALPTELPVPSVDENGLKVRPLIVPNCRVRYASEVQVPALISGRL